MERFLRRHGVRVILSQYLDQSLKWLAVARNLGARFFAHAHGYDVSKALRNPKMCREYLRLNAADGIITMSESSRWRLVDLGLNSNRIHVIPYGVDIADPPSLTERGESVRCLAVGRMVRKKGPLLTLGAFRRALINCSRLRLDFVGDGELYEDARKYICDHGLAERVKLHGGQPHHVVQDLMKQADVFLQHSMIDPETGDEEGLPVAILEAMAAGLPVLSTRHAGIPEAVVEHQTGYLVDEGDSDGMVRLLVKLGEDAELRRRLGRAGWERAQQRFSWHHERKALLKLLGLNDPAEITTRSVVP